MAKTTFRVHTERWKLFNKECKVSFLRRDAYLNHVLPGEIRILEKLPPNGEDAQQWLKNRWFGNHGLLRSDETDFAPVTLDKPVIESLSQVCDERRIPRDAFFHCALMYLTERLYEPAVVIKDPRTSKDIFGQLAEICHTAQDEEESEQAEDQIWSDMKDAFVDISSTVRKRNLEPLRPDYYQRELSFPPEKLAEAKANEALWSTLLDDLETP